jgi:hypothetical protein
MTLEEGHLIARKEKAPPASSGAFLFCNEITLEEGYLIARTPQHPSLSETSL